MCIQGKKDHFEDNEEVKYRYLEFQRKHASEKYLIFYWKEGLQFRIILGVHPNLGIILREIIVKILRVNELLKVGNVKREEKKNIVGY